MLLKTTKITIESEGLLVLRRGQTAVTWCPDCKAEVEALLSNEDTPIAQLLNGVPAGALHVWTAPDGTTHICLSSLLQLSRQDDTQPIQIPERTLSKGEEK